MRTTVSFSASPRVWGTLVSLLLSAGDYAVFGSVTIAHAGGPEAQYEAECILPSTGLSGSFTTRVVGSKDAPRQVLSINTVAVIPHTGLGVALTCWDSAGAPAVAIGARLTAIRVVSVNNDTF